MYPIITLRCFEPASRVISLGPEELCRHICVFGNTGSGKTTSAISPILRQLLQWQARDPGRRMGLLILDPKGDDTVARTLSYAREAGRESDVVVLGQNNHIPFFSGLRRLEDIEEYTTRVLYGSGDMGGWNAYWSESRRGLIESALTILLACGDALDFNLVAEFIRIFVYDFGSEILKSRLRFLERLILEGDLREATRRRLRLALTEAANWQALDPRTRELHKSTMANALRYLFTPTARDLFDPTKGTKFDVGAIFSGKVLVASVPALQRPELASLVFRVLKRDFYKLVSRRPVVNPEKDRLVGIIADEMALSVTIEDPESLAVIRSHGAYAVMAAQSIGGLTDILGQRRREALLNNMANFLFFSSRENELDQFAMLTLGMRTKRPDRPNQVSPFQTIAVADPLQSVTPTYICPPGALSRLPIHHCYAKLATGEVTEDPVWLEPLFHDFELTVPPEPENDLQKAAAKLRQSEHDQKMLNASPSLLIPYMHERQRQLLLTPTVVAAAWQLCVPRASRASLLQIAWDRHPRVAGWESLPSCWILGVLKWLERNAKLATIVTHVSHQSGILWLQLDGPSVWWGDGPLALPAELNSWVYPSLWRPLRPQHVAQLRAERVDLHEELRTLPQLSRQHSAPWGAD